MCAKVYIKTYTYMCIYIAWRHPFPSFQLGTLNKIGLKVEKYNPTLGIKSYWDSIYGKKVMDTLLS
jgi:hypothetical protein